MRVVLPSPCSTEAEVSEKVLLGGVKYCCNKFRLNFSCRTRSQFSLLYNFLVAAAAADDDDDDNNNVMEALC